MQINAICNRPAWLRRRYITKTLLVMKLTSIFLLVACLQVSARSWSQTVSFSGKNVSLEKVFASVKKQTGYVFFFNDVALKDATPVSVKVANMPLQEFMETVLKDQPLNFSFQNKTIVISRKAPAAVVTPPAADKVTAVFTGIDIHGVVADEKGLAIAGATVKVKGTKRATITDARGGFDFKGLDEKAVLEISFIGYATKTLPVQKTMYVSLSLAVSKLDQVQVIAFGKTTERLSTGNVTTIQAAELAKSPAPNVIQALEGLVPGLYITQIGSNGSAVYNINLRGLRSISADPLADINAVNTPLIVIDGSPLSTGPTIANLQGLSQALTTQSAPGQSPLFDINPNDIESISVLKDADASALYGSMGANGVILITTKKPKNGKLTGSANLNYGFTQYGHNRKLLNTQQYLTMRREAMANDNITPTAANAYDLLVWDTTRYTDWQKLLLGNRPTVDANVSINGGQANTTYRYSLGYSKNLAGYPGTPNGFVKSTAENRITMSLATSTQSINGRFKISNNISFAKVDITLPSGSLEGMVLLAPDAPALFTPEGKINWADWRITGSSSVANSVGGLLRPYTSETKDLNLNSTLSYQLARGLMASVNGAYATTTSEQVLIASSAASSDPLLAVTRTSSFGYNKNYSFALTASLNYAKTIGRHNLQAMAGANYNDYSNASRTINGSGWLADELQTSMSGASALGGHDAYNQTRVAATYARITYNFDEKYVLNLNGRRDGSSNFGPGNKFGNFGSVGAAWIFTKEKWLQPVTRNNIFSFGKLRGSYGIMGTPVGAPYTYLSTYTNLGLTYQSSSFYIVTRPANPNLKWSQTLKEELALDLGFFNDKLLLNGTMYRSVTSDQVLTSPVSATSGYSMVIINLPATVQNTGTEINVSYRSNPGRKLTWSIAGNIGFNHNKLLSFPNLDKSVYRNSYIVGESLTWRYQYRTTGLDPQTGRYPLFTTGVKSQVETNPKFTGGMQTQVSYKHFTISGNFTFAKQYGHKSLIGAITPGMLNSGLGNQPVQVLNRWQKPGDVTIMPKFSSNGTTGLDYYDAAFDGDVSYFSLKNATLSYGLSEKLLQRTGLSGLSFNIRANDLFVLTPFKGGNPERPFGGIELIRRRVSFGLNISF